MLAYALYVESSVFGLSGKAEPDTKQRHHDFWYSFAPSIILVGMRQRS